MVYSTWRFVLCLTLCYFVLAFFSPFSIVITSLEEERANLNAFRTFVRFVLVWFCRFPLPLGVREGLRFVIVELPGLFSYLFLCKNCNGGIALVSRKKSWRESKGRGRWRGGGRGSGGGERGVGVLNQFDSCEISSLVLRQPNYKHMFGSHRDALPFPCNVKVKHKHCDVIIHRAKWRSQARIQDNHKQDHGELDH